MVSPILRELFGPFCVYYMEGVGGQGPLGEYPPYPKGKK